MRNKRQKLHSLLALGVLPLIIKAHVAAMSRIQQRGASTARLITAAGIIGLLFTATSAPRDGLRGLAIGWLFSLFLEPALLLQTMYRAAFQKTIEQPDR